MTRTGSPTTHVQGSSAYMVSPSSALSRLDVGLWVWNNRVSVRVGLPSTVFLFYRAVTDGPGPIPETLSVTEGERKTKKVVLEWQPSAEESNPPAPGVGPGGVCGGPAPSTGSPVPRGLTGPSTRREFGESSRSGPLSSWGCTPVPRTLGLSGQGRRGSSALGLVRDTGLEPVVDQLNYGGGRRTGVRGRSLRGLPEPWSCPTSGAR